MSDPDLVARVAASTGLSAREATRVVDDVVSFYRESTEAYIRRRHARLRIGGVRNTQIYQQISAELADRVVAPTRLSERQIRRVIYG